MKRIGFAVATVLLALFAIALYSLFEIQPMTRRLPPSRDARINEYLALDRWLQSSGLTVRTESSANLSMLLGAEERQIFIQASLFRWTDEAVEYLVRWIEEGGSLFLALDYSREHFTGHSQDWHNEGPMLLLGVFGIEAEPESSMSAYRHETDLWFTDFPNYDSRVSFIVINNVVNEQPLILNDSSGHTRLVQIKRGDGKLTVSGRPLFLLSSNLDRAPNARLAWALFATDSVPEATLNGEEAGWLFIRGLTRTQGLFGSLFRQGNLVALIVSLLVLLLTGFWAVIPAFGLLRGDDEKPLRPLRERFLTEGRFLKRYDALGFYRAVYIKEIKRRLGRKKSFNSDAELQRYFLELLGRPIDEQDFLKIIKDYKTILERI